MYDLKKHYLADEKIILNKISSVLKKGVLEMGEEVEKFEDNFKSFENKLYTKNIESSYKKIYERYQSKLKPENIYIK